jgi:hypothetical protein
MGSTVRKLLAAAELQPEGIVQWREPVPEGRPGVYLVSLSQGTDQGRGIPTAPVSDAAIRSLLATRPELTVDGKRPTKAQLAARIAAFWLPEEVVVYIGLAGTSLRTRIGQYYKTPLGARRPHAGGWFLKTLANLGELYVHYSRAGDPTAAEDDMLRYFCAHVSAATLGRLPDPAHPFPFANLEWPRGVRKAHGITGARGD